MDAKSLLDKFKYLVLGIAGFVMGLFLQYIIQGASFGLAFGLPTLLYWYNSQENYSKVKLYSGIFLSIIFVVAAYVITVKPA